MILLAGICTIVVPPLLGPVQREDVETDFPLVSTTVLRERFEDFRDVSIERNTIRNDHYWELAIYAPEGRFFFRAPSADDLIPVKARVKPGDEIELRHITNEERGRGHRIVALTVAGEPIVTFADTQATYLYRSRVITLVGSAFILAGAILYVFARRIS